MADYFLLLNLFSFLNLLNRFIVVIVQILMSNIGHVNSIRIIIVHKNVALNIPDALIMKFYFNFKELAKKG